MGEIPKNNNLLIDTEYKPQKAKINPETVNIDFKSRQPNPRV